MKKLVKGISIGFGLFMCIALKEKLFNPKPDDISFSLNLQIINYKWSPEADAVINSYSDFLSGNLSVNNIDIDTITLPKGEKNRHYETKYALKSGGFISWNTGAAPMSDGYCFFIFDSFGEEIYNISFSKYDLNKNGVYDNDDEYWFDNIKVSKEIWENLSSRYLYVDDMRGEKIRNEIDWITLFEENN